MSCDWDRKSLLLMHSWSDSLYLRALLLQSSQLSLVQVGSVRVNFGQLSVGVHELLHRLFRNAGPDGGVDAVYCFEHCRRVRDETAEV